LYHDERHRRHRTKPSAPRPSPPSANAAFRWKGQHRRRRHILGHPLGATGARITAKATQIMKREGMRLALATQCIGGGQGIATVIEAV
jgi:hypothetical protein